MKQDIERLQFLLSVGEKEQKHLDNTANNLKFEQVDESWMKGLDRKFVIAFDNLNRMEKLGLLSSLDERIKVMWLRNKLIHEYIVDHEYVVDSAEFALGINQAIESVKLLNETSSSLRQYAQRFF